HTRSKRDWSSDVCSSDLTDIPPHNLAEIIDGVIMKIDKPSASVDDLMKVIKGPDFPTGGILQGVQGIKEAYETGKGRVVVRGKKIGRASCRDRVWRRERY